MKLLLLFVAASVLHSAPTEIYSSKQLDDTGTKLLNKKTQFASADLARYGNHYTMLAVRDRTGSSEVHEHEADIFIIQRGEATLLSGGKIVNPHTQKPGEIRGTSIAGGERHPVAAGDIIHIPAGEPHQLLIETGKPFSYFVVKVTGQ